MRAALLPTPGDPFMLAYWLRNFETWRDCVDELVVCLNGPGDAKPMLEGAGAKVITYPWRLGHDGAINVLLDATAADYVVLCEDDAYVRHPEAVEDAFDRVEYDEVDIVGSPRHEDYAASPLQVWPRELGGEKEELRRGLWPAFLFCWREDLTESLREFGDRRWNIGERLPHWRAVTAEDCEYVGIAPDFIHLDTLFGTTFELRGRGLPIDLVHHVRLFEAQATEEWVAEDPPWFHVTGLSTLDEVLAGRDLPDMDDHGGLWTRRLAWWYRTVLTTDLPGRAERLDALVAFMGRAGIAWDDVNAWTERFDRWVTWDERVGVAA